MILHSLSKLTRYYPFQQPRASLLKLLPDVPIEHFQFQSKDRIEYVAYLSGQDYIVKNLFWFGDFESWVTAIIHVLVAPNEVVCDIGANIGDTTLQLLTTFDTWLDESNISQVISVCKVDVEGHELEVFEGMKDALENGRIGSIVFERTYQECDDNDPVIQLLHHYHYKVFKICKSFRKVAVMDLASDSKFLRETLDYVAVLEGSVHEERLRPLMIGNNS